MFELKHILSYECERDGFQIDESTLVLSNCFYQWKWPIKNNSFCSFTLMQVEAKIICKGRTSCDTQECFRRLL